MLKLQTFRQLVVGGLRGLSAEHTIHFAEPNGTPGSGLTMLVGSNNAGKSTFIEALRLLAQRRPSSLSEGRRNKAFGDRVYISLAKHDGSHKGLRSISPGGSETEWTEGSIYDLELLVLPSRRGFTAFFGDPGASTARNSYAADYGVPALKVPTLDHFGGRLSKVNRDQASREQFEKLLRQVVDPVPQWTIDQTDSGQFFLKFKWQDSGELVHSHSSDGLGEGLISLFFIVDSLYDSEPGSMTVIDEPELSLHPQFQRRLRSMMSVLAADRQIAYATHSPYFVDWDDISNGAQICRVFKTAKGTQIAEPRRETLDRIVKFARDANNPHVLGLDASEVFFLDDRIVLVEGQEDVVFLRRVIEQLDVDFPGTFFGWGVGGAEKMASFALLLHELKYSAVFGILDGDKLSEVDRLASRFPEYRFRCIPAQDVRTKSARPATDGKVGLVGSDGHIRPEYVEDTRELFADGASYLRSPRIEERSIL